jgi:hypothetical protein
MPRGQGCQEEAPPQEWFYIIDKNIVFFDKNSVLFELKPLLTRVTIMKESTMADPCVGCGKTEIHPFEGLVRSIMDGDRYYVHGMPPLQSLHGECGACKWHIMHRVIPEYCPRCGYPTRVVLLDETSSGSFPHQGMAAGERGAEHSGR